MIIIPYRSPNEIVPFPVPKHEHRLDGSVKGASLCLWVVLRSVYFRSSTTRHTSQQRSGPSDNDKNKIKTIQHQLERILVDNGIASQIRANPECCGVQPRDVAKSRALSERTHNDSQSGRSNSTNRTVSIFALNSRTETR